MTRTMRILTFLMLAIVVGTGQTWAEALPDLGYIVCKEDNVTGGTVTFYTDAACEHQIDFSEGKTDRLFSSDLTAVMDGDKVIGYTVYIKATAAPGYTAIGVTFTATKGIGSNLIQAPRRIGIASDIAVSAVTGKPGIYSFTMPEDGNFTVTVNATFALPATQKVSYVDENYDTHTNVDAYVLDETMHVLPAGFYVVPNDLTVDHNIESNSGKGSSVTIIIADGKTLTVNGSFSMPCDLSFFGQGNATGKLTINTTTDIGTSLGGRLTVAHVDITSDGGSLGGFNGCIFAGHQTNGNTVTVRSNGDAIGGGSNDVTIKYCNVDLVSESGSCITTGSSGSSGLTVTGLADGSNMLKLCSKSIAISGGNKVTIKYCDVDIINERNSTISCPYDVTIEGVATGNKVNTVIVRSDGSGINTSNPVTISYCNVEMTGTTQTDNVYDACGSSGITTSGGVVITGRTDANNTLKIRCGGKTSPNSYGIAGGQKAVSISRYNVNIVNENFYGIYTSDDVTITGGQVEITGGTNGKGIYSATGNITYTWVSTTDYIKASSYFVSDIKSMKTAEGQRFVAYDDASCTTVSTIVSGSNKDTNPTFTLDGIAGKTLKPFLGYYVSVPAGVAITGKTADFTLGTTSCYIYDTTGDVVTLSNSLGYPCTYSVNGTPLDGNTFTVKGDDVVTVEWHTVTITLTDTYDTFYFPNNDLDFSGVTGLTAYIAAGYNYTTGIVTMIHVTSVPAGTALVLHGNPGEYVIPMKLSTCIYANLLKGTTAATSISPTDGSYTNYMLGKENDVVGFYPLSATTDIAAGKAYLQLPTKTASAHAFVGIQFEEEATGIGDAMRLNDKRQMINDKWYTLDGRKLDKQPTKKGVFIMNGKKIVIR